MRCLIVPTALIVLSLFALTAFGQVPVFVSIPPQANIVMNVGGDRVHVETLISSGQNPHTFEPSPSQLVALSKTRLYFSVDLPFETRLLTKLHSISANVRIVDILDGLPIERVAHGEHHHDHSKELDLHVWLSPPLLKMMASNVSEALKKADSEHAKDYEENLRAYREKIDETHSRIEQMLAQCRGRSFYVFHQAFGHFAEAYGLKQIPIEVQGKEPTPRQLAQLIGQAREERISTIFVQPEFDKKAAETIAKAIGGKTVVMDPLAKDILENLVFMAESIRDSMKD